MDAAAIRRMLENLITNAIKYGSDGRPITLSLSDHENSICYSVHNFGNPIPESKQKSIFEFLSHNTTENSTSLQSWGMGLTLVKIVAEAHGGKVELTSNEEEGTIFSVFLSKHNQKPGKTRTSINKL